MKPIIAITSEVKPVADPRTAGVIEVNINYTEMVMRAGGVPIILPPNTEVGPLLEFVDGWLIPGGRDIDARNFGEANHPEVELQIPSRYEFEEQFYRQIDREMPVLGICYGCQFLNVVSGGSLIQHLPDFEQLETHTGGEIQEYHIDAGSKVADALGVQEVSGKSYHHQAIKSPGRDVNVVGHHSDGTVEAIEIEGRPFVLGVQWHPERTPDDPATQKLFSDFVAQAKKFHEDKHFSRV